MTSVGVNCHNYITTRQILQKRTGLILRALFEFNLIELIELNSIRR
uniref:Uncharacterized protein n=1 Tax=Anguilla anguilla TaxID=7936 RepID=A0A0E9W5S3_ANGAN